jgi:3-oxoacyl-[acyl-carrier-protein] synthase II
MGAPRRVVITGLGTVNASTVGGRAAVAAALTLNRSGIAPVRAFATDGGPSRLAAEVDDAALGALLDRDAARRLPRISRMAVAAATLAVQDAGLGGGAGLGMVVGTEFGDFRSSGDFAKGFLRRGPAGLSPMLFPSTVMNAMASVAAIALDARAPSVTVNQPVLAGDVAAAQGAGLIAAGRAGAVVAGGVDAICEDVYVRLSQMRTLSPMDGRAPEGCRPYAPDHNGPVLGEGATFLVLEELEAARARGARVIAELTRRAWGNVPAAPHSGGRRRPDPGSPVRRLLAEGATPVERCYGAGNGDPAVDDWELALLEADLGPAAARLLPPLSLAPLFGQHAGLGVLRVAAAALDAARGAGPVLVHGIARGGCRTALVVGALA